MTMPHIEKKKYKYWQDGEYWLGYLEEFPDYMTQGMSFENLKENLADLYKDLTNDSIAAIRKVGELDVS